MHRRDGRTWDCAMNDRRGSWCDAPWLLVPFSLMGVTFGHAIRNDAMTHRQWAAVGAHPPRDRLRQGASGQAAGVILIDQVTVHPVGPKN